MSEEMHTQRTYKDLSRQQQEYAIVDSPFDRGGYLVAEVLHREGGMVRIADSILSEKRTLAEAQSLLDQWEEYDRTNLVGQFETWEQVQARKAETYNREMDERNRISYENREKPWLPLYDGE